MIDNTSLLKDLIVAGKIRIHDSQLFCTTVRHFPSNFDFEKVEGMLLGAAIGDSLGATSEGISGRDRIAKYGEIRNYLPGHRSDNKPIGMPTDDTQLTFWTLKQLIRDYGLIPDNLAKRFCKHHITGIGSTVRAFISNYKDSHKSWDCSGEDSLGNGALMRISPIVVPYLHDPNPSMYADAAIDAMLTHNSYANNAACVAFVHILWLLLSMKKAPVAEWWSKTYCSVAKELEGDSQYSTGKNSRIQYTGSLWQYADMVVNDALQHNYSILEASEKWGSWASLFETVPCVLYILAKHSLDPEEAIIRAVNDTGDNDTIGSIVGAAIGALHGLKGIPNRWIEGLTGRTKVGIDDSGTVFKLILAAKKTFWL